MSISKMEIYKLALINLGISTTTVMGPSSTDRNFVLLENYYQVALEKTLRDHDWNSASAFRVLTLAFEPTPHPNYLYCYDYPNDCLVIRELYQKERNAQENSQISYANMRSYHSDGTLVQHEKQLFTVGLTVALCLL